MIAVGDEPPNEFRIFAVGENTSTKGSVIFDEHSARAVMAEYQKHGVDVMIDLEHMSLDTESRNYDPDARGWCRLELRNGELWAVDVRWTPEGETRLREKRQRYISPAFKIDPKTRRVVDVFNVAITALPATDQIAPLVAASRRVQFNYAEGDPMSQEQLIAIAEALGLGADANVEDIIATITAMVDKVKGAANGTSEEPAADEAAAAATAAPEEEPAPLQAASRLAAASRTLVRLSGGKKEIGEIVSEIESWRESHLTLEAEREKNAKTKATLESSERRKLVGELVKLGAETPFTAWASVEGVPDGKTPCKRLAEEPLDELKGRVAQLSKRRSTSGESKDPPARATSSSDDGEIAALTPAQLEICKQQGCTPAEFVRLRKIYSAPVAG